MRRAREGALRKLGDAECQKLLVDFKETSGRTLYVCQSFADLQVRQPGLVESMVIHELLHTLGLGENPPTSIEITQRVEARCR